MNMALRKDQIQIAADDAPDELYLTYIAGFFADDEPCVRLVRHEERLVLVVGRNPSLKGKEATA